MKTGLIESLDPEDSRNELIDLFASPPPPSESEDCLYLNIWQPSSDAPSHGRAVLFWLFGGDLTFGHGGLPLYDGSQIALREDIIVVTINYRTNGVLFLVQRCAWTDKHKCSVIPIHRLYHSRKET